MFHFLVVSIRFWVSRKSCIKSLMVKSSYKHCWNIARCDWVVFLCLFSGQNFCQTKKRRFCVSTAWSLKENPEIPGLQGQHIYITALKINSWNRQNHPTGKEQMFHVNFVNLPELVTWLITKKNFQPTCPSETKTFSNNEQSNQWSSECSLKKHITLRDHLT